MGLVAVAGGCAYKIIHILWLKKFDSVIDFFCLTNDDDKLNYQADDEVEIAENGEGEKLNASETKMKDASTSMSQERLSLMIKYNQIGSLTSLSRSKVSYLFIIFFTSCLLLYSPYTLFLYFQNKINLLQGDRNVDRLE